MTENSQSPAEANKPGNKFWAILKKLNIFVYFKKKRPGDEQEAANGKNIDEMLVEKLNTQRLPSWKQLKYIPRFLSPKEKNIMRAAVIIIVMALGLMTYLLVKDNLVEKPAKGGIYAEMLVGAPQNVNPLYAASNEVDKDLLKLTFSGLVGQNSEGELIADLAKEWFINEAKTQYTFKLRDDIDWPDGEKFTSADVIFTIEAIQNPVYESPLRASWTGIAVEAIDEYTVQFTLPAAYDTLLKNLTVGILPAHLWQDVMPGNATLAELNLKPVGLGPYQFDSFVKDKQGYIKSYTLKANENYHLDGPYIEEITFKFQPTFEAAVDALENRNADGLSYLPQNLKNFLETRKDLVYYSVPLPQYTAIFFNQTKNAALADKKVREALSLAIKKNKIVEEVLYNEATVLEGPLTPGMPGYEKAGAEQFDLEKAKGLLAEAGWQKKEITAEESKEATTTEGQLESDGNGWSKFLFKNGQELTIEITTTDQPQSLAIGELIQKYWQGIGVKVNLKTSEAAKIQKEVIAERNFEALLFGEILGGELDLYPFWHSSAIGNQGLNIAAWRSELGDKLLEAIRKETNQEEKAKKLKELDILIRTDLPAIFLYNPNYTYVIADKIKGVDLKKVIDSADRLNGITGWYIKTKKGFK
ncbi:MAG TPA: peptide ABC transporter substrate-binding protein [bacterium]|nr:peptide ABC transporter substrate-binding protein [bacterium]